LFGIDCIHDEPPIDQRIDYRSVRYFDCYGDRTCRACHREKPVSQLVRKILKAHRPGEQNFDDSLTFYRSCPGDGAKGAQGSSTVSQGTAALPISVRGSSATKPSIARLDVSDASGGNAESKALNGRQPSSVHAAKGGSWTAFVGAIDTTGASGATAGVVLDL
jgi:hypothetical protein